MKSKKLLNYTLWSQNIMKSLIGQLSPDDIDKEFDENVGSIKARLLHLAEETMGWLFDIQYMDLREEVNKISLMNHQELLSYIDLYFTKWIEFYDANEDKIFEIKEEGKTLNMHIDELVFNLVNHTSYHRGQIITLLRRFDIEPVITDYFWFKMDDN